MSRRKRWQPPHPDPAKIQATPTSTERRRRAGQQGGWSDDPKSQPCIWPRCPHTASLDLSVPLCRPHARIIANDLASQDALARSRRTSVREERLKAMEEAAQLLEAGQQVDDPSLIPGWIYYLRIDDTIKIGYAKIVKNRMRSYPPSAQLLAVEPGTKKIEAQRHDHFNAYLAHGREWFRDVPELRTWIASLIARYGKPTHFEYTYRTPQSGKQVTTPRSWTGHKRTAA